MADSILDAVFTRWRAELEWTMGFECLAKLFDHDRSAACNFLPGVVERILAAGNGFAESRCRLRRVDTQTLLYVIG